MCDQDLTKCQSYGSEQPSNNKPLLRSCAAERYRPKRRGFATQVRYSRRARWCFLLPKTCVQHATPSKDERRTRHDKLFSLPSRVRKRPCACKPTFLWCSSKLLLLLLGAQRTLLQGHPRSDIMTSETNEFINYECGCPSFSKDDHLNFISKTNADHTHTRTHHTLLRSILMPYSNLLTIRVPVSRVHSHEQA